jgi:DNA-binding NarL/FixJ family response regulator
VLDALVSTGGTNKHIGRELGIEEATVKTYMKAIYRSTGIEGRVPLALWWARVRNAPPYCRRAA